MTWLIWLLNLVLVTNLSHLTYAGLVSAGGLAIGLVLAGRMVDRLGTRVGYVVVMSVWSLAAMGHAVKSINGAEVGGFQAILFTAVPDPEKPDGTATIRPLNGFYRAGSDPRKDGQAVGW